MKKIITAVILAIASASAFAAVDIAPDALARSVTDEVLAIVRADKELQAGHPQKVMQLVESKVLPHFNFTRMTQLAVGRNWRQASPQQQQELTDEFRTLLVRTYTAAFTQYRNQTNWVQQTITLAAFDNQPTLRFGFRFVNGTSLLGAAGTTAS